MANTSPNDPTPPLEESVSQLHETGTSREASNLSPPQAPEVSGQSTNQNAQQLRDAGYMILFLGLFFLLLLPILIIATRLDGGTFDAILQSVYTDCAEGLKGTVEAEKIKETCNAVVNKSILGKISLALIALPVILFSIKNHFYEDYKEKLTRVAREDLIIALLNVGMILNVLIGSISFIGLWIGGLWLVKGSTIEDLLIPLLVLSGIAAGIIWFLLWTTWKAFRAKPK